jgi:hypothetical protein
MTGYTPKRTQRNIPSATRKVSDDIVYVSDTGGMLLLPPTDRPREQQLADALQIALEDSQWHGLAWDTDTIKRIVAMNVTGQRLISTCIKTKAGKDIMVELHLRDAYGLIELNGNPALCWMVLANEDTFRRFPSWKSASRYIEGLTALLGGQESMAYKGLQTLTHEEIERSSKKYELTE